MGFGVHVYKLKFKMEPRYPAGHLTFEIKYGCLDKPQ